MTVEIPKTRSIPVWLAVLLILACAGGGGYLAYRILLGGSHEKIVLLEHSPNDQIQQVPRRRNQWTVTSGIAILSIDMSNPQKPGLYYGITRHDLSHEQNVLLALGQPTRWGEFDGNLSLSDDQWDKIHALGAAAHIEPSKTQMNALRDLFLEWYNTPPGKPKEDLEDKLLTMLDDDTQALDAQSKAAQVGKADKVRAILTTEQQQKVPSVRLPWQE